MKNRLLTVEDEALTAAAFAWVKENEETLVRECLRGVRPVVGGTPVTTFMAGSPGAGKTETSLRIAEQFPGRIARIDADEIRALCPGYTGTNAHLMQRAASRGVNMLYDYVLGHGIDVIMDGTFAYKNVAINVARSLSRNRVVNILFVYQDPLLAWKFTQKRESIEGRRVTKSVFINAYLQSRENVRDTQSQFHGKVSLQAVIKAHSGRAELVIEDLGSIDDLGIRWYSQHELDALL